VYRPAAFELSDEEGLQLVERLGFAHLVTVGGDGLVATALPLLVERDTGSSGALVGHMARANPHWRSWSASQPALAIVAGPDGYVSPSWYAAKRETGRVVPTWNYVVVHVQGTVVAHDDPDWLADQVRRLTDHHELGRTDPWSVDDAPVDYVTARLAGIVGVELVIERIEAKAKLSQNRSGDVPAVITGLAANDDPRDAELAAEMSRRAGT